MFDGNIYIYLFNGTFLCPYIQNLKPAPNDELLVGTAVGWVICPEGKPKLFLLNG